MKLAAMKSALTEQLREVSGQKRTLTREKTKCARSACGDLGTACSVAKLQVLQCLVVLSDGDVTRSMQYYDHVKKSVSEERRRAVADHLHTWWGSLPLPARQCWLDEVSSTGQGKFALRAAGKFATETKLHSWVLEQNLGKGVAPCTKVVLNACMDERAALLTTGFALPQSRRSRWHWMHRFRKTWGVEMGRFQNLERISPAEMLQKARRAFLRL